MNTVERRRELWTELRKVHSSVQDPLLLTGDFNAINNLEDRSNRETIHSSDMRDFREFFIDTSMTESIYVGSKFTWGNGHVYNKIDRVIVNTTWMF